MMFGLSPAASTENPNAAPNSQPQLKISVLNPNGTHISSRPRSFPGTVIPKLTIKPHTNETDRLSPRRKSVFAETQELKERVSDLEFENDTILARLKRAEENIQLLMKANLVASRRILAVEDKAKPRDTTAARSQRKESFSLEIHSHHQNDGKHSPSLRASHSTSRNTTISQSTERPTAAGIPATATAVLENNPPAPQSLNLPTAHFHRRPTSTPTQSSAPLHIQAILPSANTGATTPNIFEKNPKANCWGGCSFFGNTKSTEVTQLASSSSARYKPAVRSRRG